MAGFKLTDGETTLFSRIRDHTIRKRTCTEIRALTEDLQYLVTTALPLLA